MLSYKLIPKGVTMVALQYIYKEKQTSHYLSKYTASPDTV